MVTRRDLFYGISTIAVGLCAREAGAQTLERSLKVRSFGPGPYYFAPHANEFVSVEAAKAVLEKQGGTLVSIHQSGNRNITFSIDGKQYIADPNRIFTDAGIEATLKKYSSYSKKAHRYLSNYAQNVLKELGIKDGVSSSQFPIIALHNNTEGQYSVKYYLKGGQYEWDAEHVFMISDVDTDNFFFTTDRVLFHALVEKGINTVLQDNKRAEDDGSLSIYCGRHGISYVNVEEQQSDTAEARVKEIAYQIYMLETLIAIINAKE